MIEVVIPVRNAPHVLSLTLTHLWAYGGNLIDSVTILDNCSTDPSMRPFLEGIAGQQPNHRVVYHEKNVGVWCSINRGLAMARSEHVFVLTADVLIGPQTIPTLCRIQRELNLAFLGPSNATGLAMHPAIYAAPPAPIRVVPGVNGACWMMQWPRVRSELGFYDPRFYICNGDTDFITRLYQKQEQTDNKTWAPYVVEGLYVCHLDKQNRRTDTTAQGDVDMARKDLERFHEKWRDYPDILAAHPLDTNENMMQDHETVLGGWEQGRV